MKQAARNYSAYFFRKKNANKDCPVRQTMSRPCPDHVSLLLFLFEVLCIKIDVSEKSVLFSTLLFITRASLDPERRDMPIRGGPNLAEFLRSNEKSVPFRVKSPAPKGTHTANPESCSSPSCLSSPSRGGAPERMSSPDSASDSSESSSSTDSSAEHLAPCKCAICDGPEDGAKRCAQSGMVQRGETSDGKSEWWLMDPSLPTECSAHDRNNGPALERWMGAVRKVDLPLPQGVRASVARQDGRVPDGVVYVWFGKGITLFGDATCPPPEAAILSQIEFADPIPIIAVDPGSPDYKQVSSRQGTLKNDIVLLKNRRCAPEKTTLCS